MKCALGGAVYRMWAGGRGNIEGTGRGGVPQPRAMLAFRARVALHFVRRHGAMRLAVNYHNLG